MKVTFPHLGNTYLAIEALLQGLGHEPVTPPPISRQTVELGGGHSPEEVCLPFKIILGNMLEGLDLGADCIYMIGGWGPCRLGYYGEIQRILLQALGHDVEFITLEIPRGHYVTALRRLRSIFRSARPKRLWRGSQMAWAKMTVVEDLENLALQIRPKERKEGLTSACLREALQALREAQSMSAVKKIRAESKENLQALPDPGDGSSPLRIGIVGEIYTAAEPFANLRLEERLGSLGVEAVRTISLQDWVRNHIFRNALGLYKLDALERSAQGYLRGFIGGHGLETVARSVDLAETDLAGIIHILPLSCLPEIVAQSILPRVSAERKIPILSLVVDEHCSEVGLQTRLEAFVDLLKRRNQEHVSTARLPRR